MHYRLLTVLSFLFFSQYSIAAPSFNCKKANGSVEHYICQTSEIQRLDNELAKVYRQARATVTGNEKRYLRAEQIGWIKGRNDCWKSLDMPYCVKGNYQDRITELQVHYHLVNQPTPVFYQCKTAKLEVFFYNDTAESAALINLRIKAETHTKKLAFIAPSASGTLYNAMNLSLWTATNGALLMQYGKSDENCVQIVGL